MKRRTLQELIDHAKDTKRARAKMAKASDARRALPIGSSRARVTTANARHASTCQAYDQHREILNNIMRDMLENGWSYHAEDGE